MRIHNSKTISFFAVVFVILSACNDQTTKGNPQYPSKAALLQQEAYSLQWQDDFEQLQPKYWTVGLQDTATKDMVPGAQGRYLLNEHYDAYYTEADVFIEEGTLVLQNQKRNIRGINPVGDFNYTSGWIMSMHKVFFTEGYIEVRAQFPRGDKVWPAIWLIPEDLTWCPEWDLFEYFGYREGRSDLMGMHLCYEAYPNQQWADYFIEGYDGDYDCEQWHTYGFAWTADYAIWYIDDQPVRYLSAEGITDWPDKDMYIVLNNGTRTEAPDTNTEWPNALRIDYLKLYTQSTE